MIAPHIAKWALNKKQRTDGEMRVAAVEATHISNINDKPKKPAVDKEERVLETKGGGGYVPPPQPSAMELAQARDWESRQEFERELRRQEREDKLAADKKAEADAAWQTGRGSAYQSALNLGTSRLNQLGLQPGDKYGLGAAYNERINAANAALQSGGDYASAFSPTIFDEVAGNIRTGQRNRYTSDFNKEIDPYYAEDRFGSTADDAILASILNDQYGTASMDLAAARDRGQLSSIAYDRALKDLGTAKSTANSELQTIGGGVLSGITDEFGNRRSAALDDISDWDFAEGDMDIGRSAGRLRDYATQRQTGLEGDIRGAVGGKEFFDVPSLIGKASARVGNQTTGTTGQSALLDTFQNEANRNSAATRQNEGIF